MYAKTVLLHPSMASHTFENADALFGVKPARPEPHASLDLFSPGGTWVVNEVYGDSRHDYFTSAVAELCALSGINGLEFFQGKLKTPCRWKLPLGIEDGVDEVYGYACGYWLEGPELLTAHDALARLLD